MEISCGLSLGSSTGAAPLAGGAFFLAPFSAAAFFSSSSFRFLTSSSVSYLYMEAITHFYTLIYDLSTFTLISLSNSYCYSAVIS